MTLENEEILEGTIVRAEGKPNSPGQPIEQSKWLHFKSWLSTRFKKGESLATQYASAKSAREENESKKTVQEAAEIAARKDSEIQRKKILDQEEVIAFCTAVNDIFADDGLAPEAKDLKFAKLMEKNPQIMAQLDKVKEVKEKLAFTRGFNLEIVDKPKRYLSE